MISEAFAAAPGTIGFRSRSTLDESPEAIRKTQLAVARAKEGDQDAVRFLYVSYSHNIYGYVRSIVRDDHEAEDVTQHVFAKLMTTVVKYDDRGIPFFAWLVRLARNVAIDQLRANGGELLRAALAKAQAAGVQAESEIVDGDAADTIVQLAKDKKADAIVLGSHGRAGFQRLLLGSVAEAVLRKSSVPVLIAKSGEA